MKMPDPDKVPLLEALEQYAQSDPAYFCIPAHHMGQGIEKRLLMRWGSDVFAMDLTETDGLDDLHDPQEVLAEAQSLAADAWGSDRCFFLVNGSTSGIEAMFLATLRPGDKVLLARNVHQSVLSALILTGAIPIWILPDSLNGWHLSGPVTASVLETALQNDPEIRAVFLTSPTYYGVCSPLRSLAEICHRYGVPLFVDEAHGAHFAFSSHCPESAIAAGADLVVQSLHKTGGSLTQSSLLHLQGSLLSWEDVQTGVRMTNSSSPSYLLMASLDAARHQLTMYGAELLERACETAKDLRAQLQTIDGLRNLTEDDLPPESALDPLRLTISLRNWGMSGIDVKKRLYALDRISVEMADAEHLVAVLSWGNTRKEVSRLVAAMRKIKEMIEKSAMPEFPKKEERALLPTMHCTPREAFYAEDRSLPLEETVGMVAAEAVIPYPPGVACLYPGEKITEDIIAQIRALQAAAVPIHGARDRSLCTLRVLR